MESAIAVFGNITEGARNGMDVGRVIRMIIETCPKCGGELKHLSMTTYPPISKKVCTACSWSWTEERESDSYVPFDDKEGQMICSKCGEKLKCIDSRQIGGYRWRRYVCPGCGLRGNTREYPERYWKTLKIQAKKK